MTKTDKQFGNQDTFLDTPWKALPESIQERVANGIEGITRSLLATIPVDLVDLLYIKGNDHRPGETGANTIMAALYMEVAHISESFFLEHIHTDAAMQYALNTETLQHQPFSANTFYRLRTRLNSIYEETGRDILEEITDMMNFAMEEEIIGNRPHKGRIEEEVVRNKQNTGYTKPLTREIVLSGCRRWKALGERPLYFPQNLVPDHGGGCL